MRRSAHSREAGWRGSDCSLGLIVALKLWTVDTDRVLLPRMSSDTTVKCQRLTVEAQLQLPNPLLITCSKVMLFSWHSSLQFPEKKLSRKHYF